ncbi:MAG TPA: Abi-alpha family protein [Solirubrobacterales bacterium]|nr:Abi-alpha family protein [Solirubrobacterales bacterium]
MSDDPAREDPARELLRAAPGVGRIAAATGLRLAGSAATAYGRAISRLAQAAAEQRPGAEAETRRPASDSSTAALRRRGEDLLRESADVRLPQDSHPAYMRILDSLAPDEARILRFLACNGSQPAVDVRSGLPFASELLAQGRTMIAEEAGCRHADRVYAYLNNLHRLGLIWFLREPLRDAARYQVLEAQPEVVAALDQGGRTARTVRRSIVLTPFGEDFCATCLPLA